MPCRLTRLDISHAEGHPGPALRRWEHDQGDVERNGGQDNRWRGACESETKPGGCAESGNPRPAQLQAETTRELIHVIYPTCGHGKIRNKFKF